MLCTIAAACMAYLPRSNTWGRLVCFWLVNSQSVGFTVSLTTISSNMAGYTHRSLASALVLYVSIANTVHKKLTLSSTAYCWGNFAGPFVVKPSEAPRYEGATIGLLVGYAIKFSCHLGLLSRNPRSGLKASANEPYSLYVLDESSPQQDIWRA
jgi:hypothetical protein